MEAMRGQVRDGRYLYRLPAQWCDYDPAKKRFVKTPALPSWAMPRASALPPPPASPSTKPATIGVEGANRLVELATRKGTAISAHLPRGIDAPGLLTAGQARNVWKALSALPDVLPTNGASGTVHIETDAAPVASRPAARSSSVPF
jgi:hypothetical protein